MHKKQTYCWQLINFDDVHELDSACVTLEDDLRLRKLEM